MAWWIINGVCLSFLLDDVLYNSITRHFNIFSFRKEGKSSNHYRPLITNFDLACFLNNKISCYNSIYLILKRTVLFQVTKCWAICHFQFISRLSSSLYAFISVSENLKFVCTTYRIFFFFFINLSLYHCYLGVRVKFIWTTYRIK